MSQILWTNNAASSLAGGITNTSLTCNLQAGTGALFPSPGSGQFFCMTFVDAATELLREIVHVTAVSGDVFTIVRGQEGTTALNWSAGDLAQNLITAASMAALVQQDVNGFSNVQVFTSSGTFVVPAGVTKVRVRQSGGGGGSGGTSTTTSSQVSASAGGNGGAYGEGIYSLTAGQVVPVTIGAGGAAGTSGGGSGGTGGTTSFGSFLTTPGGHGSGGVPANPAPLTQGPGPVSNVATGGTVINGVERAGGISASGSLTNFQGGSGGAGPWGGGTTNSTSAAIAGLGPGAGAGGAATGPSGAGIAGAAGAAGLCIVEW